MALHPPNTAPTIPALPFGAEALSNLTLEFIVAGITGVGSPITYQCIYSTNRAELDRQRNFQVVTGDVIKISEIIPLNEMCTFTIRGLIVGQTYFFTSRSVNNIGYRTSQISPGITIARDPAPSKAPTIPAVVGSPTPTNTTITFSSAGIIGDAPLTYKCLYGDNILSLNNEAAVTSTGGTNYSVSFSNLVLGTTYYFASQVTNNFSTRTSLPSLGVTIIANEFPPSMAPSVPVATVITATSIMVTFNVIGITGSPLIDYQCSYGENIAAAEPLEVTLSGPDTYSATATNLISGRSYYFQSGAYNDFGIRLSEFSGPIRTYSKPASSPTPRVSGSPTSSSITVEFDINGILGTAPFEFKCYYGQSPQPILEVPIEAVSNSTYSATINGLSSNTLYYFQITTINPYGSTSSSTLQVQTDVISVVTPICYVEGTQLLTPSGYVPIENLRVGDSLLTRGIIRDGIRFFPNADKANIPSKIIWIGRFIVKNPDFYSFPIRIKKHALTSEAGRIPSQDLSVSPNHRIIINDIIMSAKRLVNNSTIIVDSRKQPVTYYHVELSSHSVILANDVLAESYLDVKNRHMFEVQQFVDAPKPKPFKLTFRR